MLARTSSLAIRLFRGGSALLLNVPVSQIDLQRAAPLGYVSSWYSQHLRFDISLDGGAIAASLGQTIIVHW
jgi:hypothetical protein